MMAVQDVSTPLHTIFTVEASAHRLLGDIDICDNLAFGMDFSSDLNDLNEKFDSLDDILSVHYLEVHNNNNSVIERAGVIVKQELPTFTTYTSLQPASYLAPYSPSGSSYSTDDFPTEVEDLNESGIECDEMTGDVIQTLSVPVVKVEVVDCTSDSVTMDISEEEESVEGSATHLLPLVRSQSLRAVRRRRKVRSVSPDTTDTESDPDFDPAEYDMEPARKRLRVVRKTHSTSDYESDRSEDSECSEKGRKRRPSKNPIPQQRKQGSKLKISQWIVSLLRNPQYNPSIITWVDEAEGKFKIIKSDRYAELWGKVKGNPHMNYEKLSRAMRYYYKNKEIQIVPSERLTYAFGPSMKDFHAKNRADPNFDLIHNKQ